MNNYFPFLKKKVDIKKEVKEKEVIKKDFLIQKLELEKEQLLSILANKDNECSELKGLIDKNNEYLKLNKTLLNKYYNLYDNIAIMSSIHELDALIKYINESILNVIEVENSSVLLFDTKGRNLILENTNHFNENNLKVLKNNINNEVFFDAIESGSLYIENNIEKSARYSFIGNGQVKSFCCIPINTVNKKYGIILLESTEKERFNNEVTKLINYMGFMFAQSIENIMLYERITELATLDGLTGIYNRRYFQERLTKEINMALNGNYPLSLIIFDIDFFKKINDTYSHQVGDKVLKEVVNVVKKHVKRSEVFARYGGEEFVIILPNKTTKETMEFAEKIRKDIETHEIPDRRKVIKVTVSFGVASCPDNANSESNLIKVTDRALYDAKDSGRNCVKVSEEKI